MNTISMGWIGIVAVPDEEWNDDNRSVLRDKAIAASGMRGGIVYTIDLGDDGLIFIATPDYDNDPRDDWEDRSFHDPKWGTPPKNAV